MRWFLFLACAVAALAQPKVLTVRTLATVTDRGALAKGSVFEVLGEGLSGSQANAEVPYPAELEGVALRLNDTPAYLLSVSATRLVAIVPSTLPAGDATVTVRFDGKTSGAAKVRIVDTNFGAVTNTGTYGGLAVGPFSWASAIAAGGETIEFDATGLGPIADAADNDFAPEANLHPEAVLLIGDQEVPIGYLGRNPSRPGFDRVIVTLPAEGLPTGCAVPARIRIGENESLTFTLPLLAPEESACVHPLGLSPEGMTTVAEGGHVVMGGFTLARLISETLSGAGWIESRAEQLSGGFVRYSAEAVAAQTAQILLSGLPGDRGCTIYDFVDGQRGTYIDAGEKVQLDGPTWNLAIARGAGPSLNQYNVTLDATPANPFVPTPGLRFGPGKHQLTGTGGAEVGPFSVETVVSPQLQWTNRAALTEVDTSRDLVVTFTGAGADDVVTASGVVRGPAPENPSRIVVRIWACADRGSAGKIVAPAEMLRKLPKVSLQDLIDPRGVAYSVLNLHQEPARNIGRFRAPMVAGGETELSGFLFNYTFSKAPVPVR